VAAAPDRHQELVGAGELDSLDHVGNPRAAGNERGLAVDHAIPEGKFRDRIFQIPPDLVVKT
jgi:hypothetical protein